MSQPVPYMRTQADLVDAIEARLQDSSNARWTAAEIKDVLNDVLLTWQGRVTVPFIYTISGGWVSGQYEYTLPDYIREPMVPQRRVLVPYINTALDSDEWVWADLTGWDVETDGSGGQLLRTQFNEGVVGTENSARIIWYGENGPLPTTATTLNANINATATSLVLGESVPEAGRVGYVKVNNEWIQYAGVSDDGTNTTLSNLVRGLAETTAASHSSTDSVTFGVALPEMKLMEHIYHQGRAFAYELRLNDVNNTDRERSMWNMRWFQQKADEWWGKWCPRSPKMKLTRRGSQRSTRGVG